MQIALLRMMGQAVDGKLRWPDSLDESVAALREVRKLASDVQDDALERALEEVESRLKDADMAHVNRLPALGALIDLYNVCAEPVQS